MQIQSEGEARAGNSCRIQDLASRSVSLDEIEKRVYLLRSVLLKIPPFCQHPWEEVVGLDAGPQTLLPQFLDVSLQFGCQGGIQVNVPLPTFRRPEASLPGGLGDLVLAVPHVQVLPTYRQALRKTPVMQALGLIKNRAK